MGGGVGRVLCGERGRGVVGVVGCGGDECGEGRDWGEVGGWGEYPTNPA